mgnify:CR=1 FL=1
MITISSGKRGEFMPADKTKNLQTRRDHDGYGDRIRVSYPRATNDLGLLQTRTLGMQGV